MPYTPQHKAQTRARIVECARVMFNRHGFEGVSIDDIMKEAGLTRGGFYNHFDSKDALYAEAVRSFSDCNPFALRLKSEPAQRTPRELAQLLVELYLSDDVLADVDKHCPLFALPSDVARAGLAPRAAYTQLVENMRRVFQAALGDDPQRASKALVVVNLCVGGMVIARTTDAPELRSSLRAAAMDEALRVLGCDVDRRQQVARKVRPAAPPARRKKTPER